MSVPSRFLREAPAGVRLVEVVELGLDAVDELVGERRRADPAGRRDAVLRLAGDESHHRGVAVDEVGDAGSLHLHDDALTRDEPGAVRLTDRRGREGLEVELGEGLLDRLVERGLDDLAHGVGVDRPHVRLQLRELGGQALGEQVGARRRDLAELHHHPAGVLDRETEAEGEVGGVDGVLAPVPDVDQVVVPRVTDQLTHPTDGGERVLGGADRMDQGAAQSVPGAVPGRTGDEIEHDRGRHRHDDPEEERHRDDDPEGLVLVDDHRGAHDATEPADDRDDGRPPTSEGDAEDPRAQPAHRRDPRDDEQDELQQAGPDLHVRPHPSCARA